jgi:glycosyltransferase involved in cell wall biosynthesis
MHSCCYETNMIPIQRSALPNGFLLFPAQKIVEEKQQMCLCEEIFYPIFHCLSEKALFITRLTTTIFTITESLVPVPLANETLPYPPWGTRKGLFRFAPWLPLRPMRIAVNTRFLLNDQLEGYGYFIKEVANLWANQHPEHQFHFFFDRPFSPHVPFPPNVTAHVLSPPARHPLLWKYWFDAKVAATLKALKADVFFSPDGQCSLTSSVPQCVVVHDLGFLHFPEGYRKSHLLYYKWFTPKFIRKAKTVATVSQFSKADIARQYKTNPGKIAVVYSGVKDVFAPLSFDEQTAVKERYTGGAEFFLCTGAIQPRKNLITLLKAFSIFKRRLQSSMKLVLAGRMAWKNDAFLSLLKNYKHKDDVVLTGYLEETELARLTASAYAAVYPSLFEGFGVPVLEAMKCGVPVLTSKDSAMQEITEGVAIYFDPANVDDVANGLMFVYKAEGERGALVEKGKIVAAKYTWQRTADLLWESLVKAART